MVIKRVEVFGDDESAALISIEPGNGLSNEARRTLPGDLNQNLRNTAVVVKLGSLVVHPSPDLYSEVFKENEVVVPRAKRARIESPESTVTKLYNESGERIITFKVIGENE